MCMYDMYHVAASMLSAARATSWLAGQAAAARVPQSKHDATNRPTHRTVRYDVSTAKWRANPDSWMLPRAFVLSFSSLKPCLELCAAYLTQ
jgi:hypothetical protein